VKQQRPPSTESRSDEVRSAVLPPSLRHTASTLHCSRIIAALEKQAKGHGADADRDLMFEAAVAMRELLGLPPVGDGSRLPHVPESYYGPVNNDPAIGHSLPDGPKAR